jgi:DNA (cytosine-5)-methyltransferase 1
VDGFTFVDLFAGIGGFHHAMEDLGGRCLMAVEIDPACQKVYRTKFPETPLVADIRSVTRIAADPDAPERSPEEIDAAVPGQLDVLCAGFPCQPFSKSGFQLGVRDQTRGTLFFDIMSIVIAKQPRFVILENVRNLAGPRHEATWATIVESLRDAGYCVADEPVVMSPHLLPKDLGGAPQVRDRVFVLAHRVDATDESLRVGAPLARREPVGGWDPHRWRIADHLDPDDAIPDLSRYQLRPQERGWLAAWAAFVQEIESDWLPGFPIWLDAFDLDDVPSGTPRWKADYLAKNRGFYLAHRRTIDRWRKRRWGPLKERVDDFPPSRRKLEWQARSAQPTRDQRDLDALVAHLRPSGIRVKPPTYLPALVAINQTSLVGPLVTDGAEWRRITPVEAARLQGMDAAAFAKAGVPDAVAYKQLGNAVNVGTVKFVARRLFAAAAADAPLVAAS